MSTRWYPIYQKGNPQLRIFLPNFWLKLVRPKFDQPDNIVEFECSMEMTKFDIKNYLEKIYKLPVTHVRTRIALGEFKRCQNKGYIIKGDDVKKAYVILPKNEKFEFPDIFPSTESSKYNEDTSGFDDAKQGFRTYIDKNKERRGVPTWYSF